jgi:serine protease Do
MNMSKKSILSAVFLIFIGIVFGVVLVSNFRFGIEPGFAGDPQVKLGAPSPLKNPNYDYRSLSKAFIDVSKTVSPMVVSISVLAKPKNQSNDLNDFFHFFSPNGKAPQQEEIPEGGSGVVISPDGYIMTNNHVVQDADVNKVEVVFNDKRKLKAKIIGTDPTTDIAVIKVDASDLPTAAFGNSDDLEIGEWVLAIGNPLGLQGTVTAGIVSATGRNIGILADEKGYGIENFIQTDAAINPGNSGGPLVNLNGEVVGINSAIATTNQRYQGYGFAVPINLAKTVAEDLIRNGKVRRGYLGVRITSVDETMAKALGIPKPEGVLIQSVEKDGAASVAGLQPKDVIMSVDGKPVGASNELQSVIARKHPGDVVTLEVFRDGKTIEKKITLRSRADDATVASNDSGDQDESSGKEEDANPKTLTLDNIGLTIRPLLAAEKKDRGVESGVMVTDVRHFSEAFNRSLVSGDIILDVDKKSVASPKEFKSIVDGHKGGDALLLRVKLQTNDIAFVALQIPK